MPLTPVRSAKAYEAVAERLKEAIARGEFTPGSRLPSVRALSGELGVGQAAVREALMALQAVNLVTMRQGEGTFVNRFGPRDISRVIDEAPISREDIRHLLDLRKVIEAGAARLAAERRRPENVERMRAILGRMQRELSSLDLGERADWEFHYELVRAAANPYLLALMDAVAGKMQTALAASRLALYRLPGEPEKLLEQHGRILDAVAEGDGRLARKRLLSHLEHVEAALAAFGPAGQGGREA